MSLQALHKKGYANADHTTLLLNCYTKLRDIEQLDAFIAVSPTTCLQVLYNDQAIAGEP